MTIEQFETYSLFIGVTGLILYMLYIIYKVAQTSNAGRYGYFVLFFALGLGFVGLILKSVLIEVMNI